MDLEEAYEALRIMESDFENWYPVDEDDEFGMQFYKDMFSHTKLMLEIGEYTGGDFEYLKGLLSILEGDDDHTYYNETIMTFYGALLGEYVV
ncbi:MAG: hypothetical protein LUE27_00480 [Clostridia bacterium]|nr:hypothetical protein [Clostridia bacterium]